MKSPSETDESLEFKKEFCDLADRRINQQNRRLMYNIIMQKCLSHLKDLSILLY